MNEKILLENIPFEINTTTLMKQLRIDQESQYADKFQGLAQEAL